MFVKKTIGLVIAVSLLPAAGGFANERIVAARTMPKAAKAIASTTAMETLRAKYARPEAVPYPADNVPSAAKTLLGVTLFFDPRLSVSNFIACSTCHNPGFSWGDGMARGIGHGMKTLGRRTPTALNLAWTPLLFWDGRAETLEQQALGPIQAPGEMNLPHGEMVKKLTNIPGYLPMFAAAFGDSTITKERVGKAIASFERTLVSTEAPFDRFIAGDDHAISAAAQRGFALFNDKCSCAKCHTGWRLTDDGFHDIGLLSEDIGRGSILPLDSMQHAFKTPTLRNVAERAPYMHDGSEATLEQVVDLYDHGGRVKRASLSDDIKPLRLSIAEKHDVVEFMKTLSSRGPTVEVPALPR
jgi:cytochrome c peroxidase